MAVYRDTSNGYDGKTWRVAVYYTDWQGNRKNTKSVVSRQRKQHKIMKLSFLQKRKMT